MRMLFVSNPLRGHLNTLLPLALAAVQGGARPIVHGLGLMPSVDI
jgi:UDP:flavonoid glycosyltransferase YjiC (YdhE family)